MSKKKRLTYVPIDPGEVAKYGVGMTVIHQLQNDVRYSSFDYSFESSVGYNLNLSFIPI